MYVLIMAGGTGSRFWPLSRSHRPKQLLPFFNDQPMIAATAARLAPLAPPSHTLVITSAHLVDAVREVLPDLPPENVIAEPAGRNTAPCIGLAAHIVQTRAQRDDPNADPILGVFAADHFVARPDPFCAAVERARDAARASDAIVTLGIVPTRPETGYGYLKVAPHDPASDPLPPRVARFVEKPDRARAETYLTSGDHLWNAGIFIARTKTLLDAFHTHLPELAAPLATLRPHLGTPSQDAALADVFPALPSISIDYGIMERAEHVRVVPTDAGWSDVGHWAAVPDLLPQDDHGNTHQGATVALDTRNAVLLNHASDPHHLLAAVGIDDIVVVTTDDATLVLPRDRAQQVRQIVAWLKKEGRDDLL